MSNKILKMEITISDDANQYRLDTVRFDGAKFRFDDIITILETVVEVLEEKEQQYTEQDIIQEANELLNEIKNKEK